MTPDPRYVAALDRRERLNEVEFALFVLNVALDEIEARLGAWA